MELHPHELKLLETLKDFPNGAGVAEIARLSGLNPDSVRKASLWASSKGLVSSKTESKIFYSLTQEGNKWFKDNTLPELEIYKAVSSSAKKITDLMKLKYFDVGLMWAKKKNMVKIDGGYVQKINVAKDADKELKNLERAANGRSLTELEAAELKKRGFVEKKFEKIETILITKKGLETADSGSDGKIGKLTPEIIRSGEWRKGLRPYDLTLSPGRLITGKRHITSIWMEKIRKIFLDMGFSEKAGPLVESSFWCFDALYQPQDHPSRELADTFYMKMPAKSKLPDAQIVNNVRRAHESGIGGSTGWMYKWSEDIAKKPVLRTHTTAVSARSLNGLKPPAKIFCIGRAFRNETVDYKHLPEFTQVEGIVADENVTFRDLLGYLKEFYWRLGFEKIRFRPAYFPYTEMSVEPEVYFEEKKEWVELGGAGIFRPEVTNPLGVDVPVLAWGLSLERPIALMTGLNDIRNFYFKNDLKLLRDAKVNV
ncbi:MAG: phenylalanine--tRNA ligase subunit alpha [Candidatus Aenigmarchaeota archaeon]|nr:phenylalanine--tRNA ligase subunit alpha [Candidatus Aenigmarchaeota archaeon]